MGVKKSGASVVECEWHGWVDGVCLYPSPSLGGGAWARTPHNDREGRTPESTGSKMLR